MSMTLAPALHLALALGPAGAVEWSAPTPAPAPIIGGEAVPLDQWTSVVAVIGLEDLTGVSTAYLCSGVLVDPTTVLTAAHCFEDADKFAEILVVFGDSIYTHDAARRTTAVGHATHPDYCLDSPTKCKSDAHDFGFAILADAAIGVPLIPPIVDQGEGPRAGSGTRAIDGRDRGGCYDDASMSMTLALALNLALALGPAGAVGWSAPTPAPAPIIGGEAVPLDQWTSVVAVIGLEDLTGVSTAYLCSGVLVDPTTVLTAAHCFEDADKFAEILVVFGDSIYTHDAARRTTAVGHATHPDYCLDSPTKCKSDAHDFGFAILADAAIGVPLIPPIVDQGEWDEVMVAGHDVTAVGFGAIRDPEGDDSFSGLSTSEIGHKNQVTMPFRSRSHLGLEFVAGVQGKDSCNGDSGGPVFAQVSDGSWRLIGITSRGVSPCGTGKGIYGAVFAALPWLLEATGVDLLPAGCEDGSCVDTAPKESSGCSVAGEVDGSGLAGLGLLLLLGLRPALRARARARR